MLPRERRGWLLVEALFASFDFFAILACSLVSFSFDFFAILACSFVSFSFFFLARSCAAE